MPGNVSATNDSQVITGIMGENGGTVVTSASGTVTGQFTCLSPITDTVVSTIALTAITGSLNGITLSRGIPLYGAFTSVSLTSGTAIAYNRTSRIS